jgi:hypothetical protein
MLAQGRVSAAAGAQTGSTSAAHKARMRNCLEVMGETGPA